MRFGICASMVTTKIQEAAADMIDQIAALGYDYIELPLARITALDEARFASLREHLDRADIRCESCNDFFPPSIPLTGPAVDRLVIDQYIDKAFCRAAELGASVIVFGSNVARNVPEGFPRTEAWRQFAEVVAQAGNRAADYGLNIAVEAIRRAECNFINRHSEALHLVQSIDLPRVRNLVDFYHLSEEEEPLEVIEKIGPRLEHVHLARRQGRTFPKSEQASEYRAFFSMLKKIGYTNRVSIEAYSTAFEDEARNTLGYLRSLK